MEIAGVLTAGKFLSSALEHLSKPSRPQESAKGAASETSTASESPASATAALRRIVAQYDVTHISPREFSTMIGQLHEAGALSDGQFQELSQIRADLDLQEVDPDEPLNLVDFYVDKLRELLEAPDDSAVSESAPPAAERGPQIASAQRHLQWLEKFAAIQSSADAVGVDFWA
jgi:hypothetical protein